MTYNDVCLFDYKNMFGNQYFLSDLDIPHVASSSKHRLTRVGSLGFGSCSVKRDGGKGEGFMQFTASGIKALSQVHFSHSHQMMSREPAAQERWPASASAEDKTLWLKSVTTSFSHILHSSWSLSAVTTIQGLPSHPVHSLNCTSVLYHSYLLPSFLLSSCFNIILNLTNHVVGGILARILKSSIFHEFDIQKHGHIVHYGN